MMNSSKERILAPTACIYLRGYSEREEPLGRELLFHTINDRPPFVNLPSRGLSSCMVLVVLCQNPRHLSSSHCESRRKSASPAFVPQGTSSADQASRRRGGDLVPP